MPSPGAITQKFNRNYVYLNPDPYQGPFTQRLSNIVPIGSVIDGIENLYGLAPVVSTQSDTTAHLTFDISAIGKDIWAPATSYLQLEAANNLVEYAPFKSIRSFRDVSTVRSTPPISSTQSGADAVVWFDITDLPNIETARTNRKMKVFLNLPYNSRSITAITASAPLQVDTVKEVANVSFDITSLPPAQKIMALEANDLMVVQKASGSQEIRKATMQQLSDYLQTSDTVAYKGTADFTDGGEEPATKNTGDLYINNALAGGTWAWGANSEGITAVDPGDRAIWNGSQWDVIQSGAGDVGVTEVQGTLPILVTDGDTETPIVSVRTATTTLDGACTLASAQDVIDGSTGKVVTADQLKKTNDDVAGAVGGGVTSVTGVDPIETFTDGTDGSTINGPVIKIKDAAVSQKGAVEKYDKTTDIGAPVADAYATWVGNFDNVGFVTFQAVGENFVPADFSNLADA